MKKLPDAERGCNILHCARTGARMVRAQTKYKNMFLQFDHGDDGRVVSSRLCVFCRDRDDTDADGNAIKTEVVGIDANAIHYHAKAIRPTKRSNRRACRGPDADLGFVTKHRVYNRQYQKAYREQHGGTQ